MEVSNIIKNNEPGSSWHGIHIPLHTNQEILALIGELPALSQIGINLIIVEINYNFNFISHPDLYEPNPIDLEISKKLSNACRNLGIRLIPQFQCFGHQSWADHTFSLLCKYPEFDETPGQFPNNTGIYCRSWCPQHPGVNPIIFDLFDELLLVFDADAMIIRCPTSM